MKITNQPSILAAEHNLIIWGRKNGIIPIDAEIEYMAETYGEKFRRKRVDELQPLFGEGFANYMNSKSTRSQMQRRIMELRQQADKFSSEIRELEDALNSGLYD